MYIFLLLINLVLLLFPWMIRRIILNKLFNYKIHKNAHIGYSIILANTLIMEDGSRVGNLTFCHRISRLKLGEESVIGSLNWITGMPAHNRKYFQHQKNRLPELFLDDHAAITNRHIIDCTNKITIGKFTTIAGFRSQLLTHSIDLSESRQSSSPILIGNYCFVGTNVVILPGASLGNYCILGANSLLNKAYSEDYVLYGGVPATKIKFVDKNLRYFSRNSSFVD